MTYLHEWVQLQWYLPHLISIKLKVIAYELSDEMHIKYIHNFSIEPWGSLYINQQVPMAHMNIPQGTGVSYSKLK